MTWVRLFLICVLICVLIDLVAIGEVSELYGCAWLAEVVIAVVVVGVCRLTGDQAEKMVRASSPG